MQGIKGHSRKWEVLLYFNGMCAPLQEPVFAMRILSAVLWLCLYELNG